MHHLNFVFVFWCSDFNDIFDVNWFISSLTKDVTVVKRVPDRVMRSMEKPPYTMRVPRKSTPEYYLDQVLPILSRRHVRLFHLSINWFFFFVTSLNRTICMVQFQYCMVGACS